MARVNFRETFVSLLSEGFDAVQGQALSLYNYIAEQINEVYQDVAALQGWTNYFLWRAGYLQKVTLFDRLISPRLWALRILMVLLAYTIFRFLEYFPRQFYKMYQESLIDKQIKEATKSYKALEARQAIMMRMRAGTDRKVKTHKSDPATNYEKLKDIIARLQVILDKKAKLTEQLKDELDPFVKILGITPLEEHLREMLELLLLWKRCRYPKESREEEGPISIEGIIPDQKLSELHEKLQNLNRSIIKHSSGSADTLKYIARKIKIEQLERALKNIYILKKKSEASLLNSDEEGLSISESQTSTNYLADIEVGSVESEETPSEINMPIDEVAENIKPQTNNKDTCEIPSNVLQDLNPDSSTDVKTKSENSEESDDLNKEVIAMQIAELSQPFSPISRTSILPTAAMSDISERTEEESQSMATSSSTENTDQSSESTNESNRAGAGGHRCGTGARCHVCLAVFDSTSDSGAENIAPRPHPCLTIPDSSSDSGSVAGAGSGPEPGPSGITTTQQHFPTIPDDSSSDSSSASTVVRTSDDSARTQPWLRGNATINPFLNVPDDSSSDPCSSAAPIRPPVLGPEAQLGLKGNTPDHPCLTIPDDTSSDSSSVAAVVCPPEDSAKTQPWLEGNAPDHPYHPPEPGPSGECSHGITTTQHPCLTVPDDSSSDSSSVAAVVSAPDHCVRAQPWLRRHAPVHPFFNVPDDSSSDSSSVSGGAHLVAPGPSTEQMHERNTFRHTCLTLPDSSSDSGSVSGAVCPPEPGPSTEQRFELNVQTHHCPTIPDTSSDSGSAAGAGHPEESDD